MTDYGDSSARLERFHSTLKREKNDELVVRELILHGSAYAIDEDTHFSLKRTVAEKFDIDVNSDVYVVGSAKLGFSIAPRKRFLAFGDHSDIDLAIVSHDLYQKVWHEVHLYKESGAHWPEKNDFEHYLAWGWIRPDKLPKSRTFSFSNEWWEFFRGLHAERRCGDYKIAAALYHDFSFLIRYQQRSIAACRHEVGI